jgi:hypothetical protein
MEIRTEKERRQYEVKKTHKIILNEKDYESWKKIWLDALGWRNEFAHTTSLHKIILRGNYKWHPLTDVELEIVTEPNETKNRGINKTRVSKDR